MVVFSSVARKYRFRTEFWLILCRGELVEQRFRVFLVLMRLAKNFAFAGMFDFI